ncbi:unnamed protein product [Rotaria magnacalcarata]|uniref:EGF-like domain-containing protein n=1 Tax=Rotaria magnacalcarata TaxID=392030 RepID=A0A8S3DR93_9BILA|nr:unnamed protein product [Rotaria magnacalcarata]CAF5023314.1 unnamed protein product [Rotaria magnacalcarata]
MTRGVKYCQQLNESRSLDRKFGENCQNDGKLWKFSELRQINLSAMDVLKWSTAVEQADLYAKYLSNSVISNEVSYENYVCNCTNPQTFGKYCEYQFFQGSSSFDDEIRTQYQSRWNTSFGSQLHNNRPCYQAHFECNFGLMCLDWRHVCDGKYI